MKYIVQFRLQPGSKDRAIDFFEAHGPNREPGVAFRGAWICRDADLAFVLVDAESEVDVRAAGETWKEFGSLEVHPVLDILQY